jgi:hypothetical protein
MNTVGWFFSGLALGATAMFCVIMIAQQHASNVAAQRREERKRILGYEPRPTRRPTAVGTARVSDANIKRNAPGM